MDTKDDLFLDLIESVTLDVVVRIGDDPEARRTFFRRFLELAQEVVAENQWRDTELRSSSLRDCSKRRHERTSRADPLPM